MVAQAARVALVVVVAACAGLATGDNAPTRRIAGTDRVTNAGVSGATGSRPATIGCDRCPLAFEPNLGQSDPRVKFTSHGAGYTLFLTDTATVFALRPAAARQDVRPGKERRRAAPGATMRLTLAGAARPARLRAVEPLPGVSNYVIGSDPSKWRSNVPHYARVRGEGVYPGIDVEYYGNDRQLEFDFIVAPGADPGVIALDVDGASEIELDGGGDVVMRFGEDEVRLKKPFAYQEVGGARREVASDYTIADNGEVRMRLASYDRTRPLVIDPLVYGTLLGGTGDDFAFAGAIDGTGNAYIAGMTSSTNFPTTPGVAQPAFGGGTGDYFEDPGIPIDGFVTKLNALGTAVVYSTYLGGSNDDGAFGVKVDSGGNAYITGFTLGGFPTTPGAFQTTFGGGLADGFVAKLNAGGQLVYSTYLGGGCIDQTFAIAIDTSGNAYIAGQSEAEEPMGCTQSFPTTPGAFQTTYAAAASTVTVVKLNAAGSGLVYATFLGGMIGARPAELVEPGSIAVDSDGSAYVVGKTYASDFPTTPGAFQTTRSGSPTGCFSGTPCADAFVTKFNPAGTGLVFSTYLGGSDQEQEPKVAINAFGDACVAGRTASPDFPTTPGAYQSTLGGDDDDVFVTCVSSNGASLRYSTLFGGTNREEVFSIALDTNGNAYIAGATSSSNLPTTADAEQMSFNGGTGGTNFFDDPSDAFIAKFNSIGTTLLYSTYLGGTGDEGLVGAGLLKPTTVLAAGATASANFPLTSGTYQTMRSGPSDAVVVKLTPPKNFTDEPLMPGVTVIKAIHVNELRQSLHLQRRRFGLPLFSFAGTLTAGLTVITAQHILDLRTALSQLHTAATDTPPSFAEDLTPGTAIKAAHLTEIRNAMLTFQANH